jgi:predicted nucleic acid-binding Zn ribbon protein
MAGHYIEKLCPQCGKPFHTKSNLRKYCNDECRKLSYTPDYRMSIRRCIVCDKPFTPWRPQNVYCSNKCKTENYNLIHDIAGRLREQRAKSK